MLMCSGSLILVGCGGGGGDKSKSDNTPKPIIPEKPTEIVKPIEQKADYDTYSATLPKWNDFSPLLTKSESVVADSKSFKNELIDNTLYQCSSEDIDLTSNPEKLVTFNPDVGALWVGSILQGKHYLNGLGSLAELPIRQRAPITIFIDKFGQTVSKTIDNPTAASVQQAISELVNQIDTSGTKVSSSQYFKMASAHSAEQTAMSLGISAKYAGAKLSTSFSSELKTDENRINAHFVQELFTVTLVSPQTPASLFSTEFTDAKLNEQISLGRLNKDNIPVYVSAITYGRILNYTMIAKASEDKMKAAINASYNGLEGGGSISIRTEEGKLLNEAKIEVIAIGGEQKHALNLIRSGNLKDYFSEGSKLSEAKPISYEIHNLADDTNALFSETTRYNLRSCNTGAVTVIKKTLEEHAKTNAWPDGRRNESIKRDKITLPENSYFIENKDLIHYLQKGGSENECKVSYADYYDIPLSDGKIKKVPKTVHYSARIRSPHGDSRVGTIQCNFEFSYATR